MMNTVRVRPLVPAAVVLVVVGGWAVTSLGQSRQVEVAFSPQNGDRAFEAAVEEYGRIWAAEGQRIIAEMERITTLRFPEGRVRAEVYEGPSFAGLRLDRNGVPTGTRGPMLLRASYTADVKKGTLVHELGHRMNVPLRRRPSDLDEHRLLFLYLYDLYVDLYGQEFADAQVAFGRTLKGLYDYDAAWTWTLAMTREQRASRFAEVVKANRR